jgi:hypothetical protein
VGDEIVGQPINEVYSAQVSTSGGISAWNFAGDYPISNFGESCVLGTSTATADYVDCIGGFPGFRAYPTMADYFAEVAPTSGAMGGWTDTTPYPVNIAYQSCVASAPYIYCVGGINTSDTFYTSASASSSGTSQVTVNTIGNLGQPLPGYYTVLYQGGKMVGAGFSPITFTVNNDEQYTIQMDNYSLCSFNSWLDTASIDSQKTISVAADTQYTAMYNCTPTTSTLDIVTYNSTVLEIFGYYTTLSSQQTGRLLQSCFSPCIFQVENGQNYTVTVSNFGSEKLTSWGDGAGNIYSWGGSHAIDIPNVSGIFAEGMPVTFTP